MGRNEPRAGAHITLHISFGPFRPASAHCEPFQTKSEKKSEKKTDKKSEKKSENKSEKQSEKK